MSYGGSSQGAVNAGSYAITPGGLTSSNYAVTYASGTLTVGKARLTVTADDKSRFFGDNNPALTYTITGFVNGEAAGSANLGGAPLLTTSAGTATPAGSAPIAASVGTLSARNYDFATTDGTLIILPAPPLATTPAATTTTTSPTTQTTPVVSPSTTVVTVALDNPAESGTPTGTSNPGAPSTIVLAAGENQRTASITAAVSVNLLQTAASGSNGVVTVSVPKEVMTQSGGFTFKLPDQMTGGASGDVTITATTAEGSPLPNWLRFNADSKTFVAANVPDGGLPISVAVFVNGQRTDMTIAERG
ncbi:hypothetical protein TSO221_03335 [Azospirillum sp. TSO22-1]|nr:hypothetical protein TSO221_03335 [Azospirillum sp. TSO22-1]